MRYICWYLYLHLCPYEHIFTNWVLIARKWSMYSYFYSDSYSYITWVLKIVMRSTRQFLSLCLRTERSDCLGHFLVTLVSPGFTVVRSPWEEGFDLSRSGNVTLVLLCSSLTRHHPHDLKQSGRKPAWSHSILVSKD